MIKFYGNKHLRVTRATCHEAAKKALQSNEVYQVEASDSERARSALAAHLSRKGKRS